MDDQLHDQPPATVSAAQLRDFARFGRLVALAGGLMLLSKVGLALAHGNRSAVITDVIDQGGELSDVDEASDLIRYAGWLAVTASVTWIVLAILWVQRINRLSVVPRRFGLWQRALFATVLLNILFSFAARTESSDPLAGLRDLSDRQLILNLLQMVVIVGVVVIGVLVLRDGVEDTPVAE
jgi:hypothetical protein